MGFFGKLFGGERQTPQPDAAPAHVHTEPVGDTAQENVFFGEHKAAQEREAEERALQEARDAEALAAAQNAIDTVDSATLELPAEDDETLEEERAA